MACGRRDSRVIWNLGKTWRCPSFRWCSLGDCCSLRLGAGELGQLRITDGKRALNPCNMTALLITVMYWMSMEDFILVRLKKKVVCQINLKPTKSGDGFCKQLSTKVVPGDGAQFRLKTGNWRTLVKFLRKTIFRVVFSFEVS